MMLLQRFSGQFSNFAEKSLEPILCKNARISCTKCFIVRKTHYSSTKTPISGGKPANQESFARVEELILYLKERPSKKCSYVFEDSLAKSLVSSILCNRVNPKAPLIELGSGIGLVSREFLNQGVDQVIAIEPEKNFHSYLQLIQEEYGKDRFEFFNWNMLNLYKKFNCVSERNTPSYKTVENMVVERLSRSVFMKEGGSQENHDFIFYICRNLPIEDPLLSQNRVEFFFMVHPKLKMSINGILPTNKPIHYARYYSYFHTFICLLYDITFIEEFEAKDFVPAFSRQGVTSKMDPRKRHLMRMQLKANISHILPLNHHYAFSIFLRSIFIKRTIRIVPVMEMLVAGCGLHMLADGFTMMERVADVNPQRLLQLYKSMLNWPEYSVSHLKNHILMKTQGGPMEDEDI